MSNKCILHAITDSSKMSFASFFSNGDGTFNFVHSNYNTTTTHVNMFAMDANGDKLSDVFQLSAYNSNTTNSENIGSFPAENTTNVQEQPESSNTSVNTPINNDYLNERINTTIHNSNPLINTLTNYATTVLNDFINNSNPNIINNINNNDLVNILTRLDASGNLYFSQF